MSRFPDYRLKVKDKQTGKSNIVGAAWINPEGSISIQLGLCTSIKYDSNLLITLFPAERPEAANENEEE